MIRLAASFNDDNGSIDERVDVIAFDTQFRKSDIEEGVAFSQPDTSISQLFIKSRTVAAATRVWKTSTSDNESGTLNCIYGRDGIPIDENVSLATEISRPRMDRTTVFLAQSSCSQQCRGRNGFTIQNNYRPHDEESFRFRQAERPSTETLFGSQPIGSILWVVSEPDDEDGAELLPLRQLSDIQNLNNARNYRFVASALEQRHTAAFRFEGLAQSMQYQLEFTRHIEGVPD